MNPDEIDLSNYIGVSVGLEAITELWTVLLHRRQERAHRGRRPIPANSVRVFRGTRDEAEAMQRRLETKMLVLKRLLR